MCRRCLTEKPTVDFYKDRSRKEGTSAYCKPCKSVIDKAYIIADPNRIEKRNQRSREWQKNNAKQYKETIKKWKNNNLEKKWQLDKKSHLWTHYRLTIEDYSKMFYEQNGLCLICKKARKLIVDHDHNCCSEKLTCGKCVRGLICNQCNLIVGIIENNSGIIESSKKYINKYNKKKNGK